MRISLELHKLAKKDAFKVYALPYRAYYDYLRKRAKEPSNTLMINPCYPEPGYPIDGIIRVTKSDFEIPKEAIESSPGEDLYIYNYLKPEIKAQVDAIINRFSPWHNATTFSPEWKKIFLKFIKDYDFDTFTCFDFFGATIGEINDPEIGLVDESQIEVCKAVYKRLADEYKENPERYEYQEPIYHEEYGYLYQDTPFTMLMSKDEALAQIELYNNMNMPMSSEEQAAYLKLHGVEL
jgi:hypothetical protein